LLTLEQGSRLYAIPLTDYGADRGRGLLVSSGCGMMMAAMDCAPRLRWCVDIDTVRDPRARLADFLLVAERVAEPLAVCGWFSISDPEPLRRAVLALERAAVVYTGNIVLGVPGEVRSFTAFVEALQAPREASPGRARTASADP
jgi:hypothetical protein